MEKEQKKYLLKGDISGIQNYIFDTTSKKAAQNLKACSFYVYVLTHIIEEYLKRENCNTTFSQEIFILILPGCCMKMKISRKKTGP